MSEVPLDGRLQEVRRPRVAERRPVLVQQVHQLLRHLRIEAGLRNRYWYRHDAKIAVVG